MKLTMPLSLKILGTGKYLPETEVTAAQIDARLSLPKNWTTSKAGVDSRFWVNGETSSFMAIQAAKMALDNAGVVPEDLNFIVAASSVGEQALPCTASFVQKGLGLGNSGIPCFDVNTTCFSFVTALDLLSFPIHSGRYVRGLVVSSEIPSNAIDEENPHSFSLFGDGAAAAIVGKAPPDQSSRLLASRMNTYSTYDSLAYIKGGGNKIHPREYRHERRKDFLFQMDGVKIYRAAMKHLPGMMDDLLKDAAISIDDVDLVIPHQASGTALKLLQNRLDLPDKRFVNIIANHGNTVAASIPMALHEAITKQRLQRGMTVLLLGTSAGLSVGGMLLVY